MGSSLREALLPYRAFRRQPPGVMGIWQLRSHRAGVDRIGQDAAQGCHVPTSPPTWSCDPLLMELLGEPEQATARISVASKDWTCVGNVESPLVKKVDSYAQTAQPVHSRVSG